MQFSTRDSESDPNQEGEYIIGNRSSEDEGDAERSEDMWAMRS